MANPTTTLIATPDPLPEGTPFVVLRRENGRDDLFHDVTQGHYWRASDAKKHADIRADSSATRIADHLLYELSVDPFDVARYAQRRAGRVYADAVYQAQCDALDANRAAQ